ncbi:MAG TPA: heavy metal-binding domain-containing protein [Candidatus Peribacteraceae bacterium]|nr:heavy metal-binding domain-containing protein [Candidatus Peribacteraceae bacterium]
MIYTCPMHPEIRQDTPGSCPICGMKLVPEDQVKVHAHHATDGGFWRTYQPLFIIVGLILLPTLALAWRDASVGSLQWREVMQHFMAGFFLVFSGLKLLDVPGFAEGYSTYDLLAQRVKAYGYVYPFLELLLGLAYLTRVVPVATNTATLILMLFSGLGVAISLLQHRKFQCACLGTMIKVPLTNVTLIEDFGMALMALIMLLSMRVF